MHTQGLKLSEPDYQSLKLGPKSKAFAVHVTSTTGQEKKPPALSQDKKLRGHQATAFKVTARESESRNPAPFSGLNALCRPGSARTSPISISGMNTGHHVAAFSRPGSARTVPGSVRTVPGSGLHAGMAPALCVRWMIFSFQSLSYFLFLLSFYICLVPGFPRSVSPKPSRDHLRRMFVAQVHANFLYVCMYTFWCVFACLWWVLDFMSFLRLCSVMRLYPCICINVYV